MSVLGDGCFNSKAVLCSAVLHFVWYQWLLCCNVVKFQRQDHLEKAAETKCRNIPWLGLAVWG